MQKTINMIQDEFFGDDGGYIYVPQSVSSMDHGPGTWGLNKTFARIIVSVQTKMISWTEQTEYLYSFELIKNRQENKLNYNISPRSVQISNRISVPF